MEKEEDNENDKAIDNGNTKIKKDKEKHKEEYYTGNRKKSLIVHIMQDGVEVDKPIKSKIYEQDVQWRGRQWAIVPERFYYDYQGVAHQQVDVNDVAVLTFKKDHTDTCKKCGGKMSVDARESRKLGRRGVFHAIWGIDNTHIILLIVMAIGAMAMAGAFFWAYNADTKDKTQLESAKTDIIRLNNVISQYQNMTGITITK